MPETKRIVILANSRKHWTSAEHDGRCVAGTLWEEPLSWVRPVSDREGEEVSFYERKYEDGTDPQLLDVVDVPLIRAKPSGHQRENWLIDPAAWWEKVGECRLEDVDDMLVQTGSLWGTGSESKGYENNRVPGHQMRGVRDSLRLIRVPNLEVSVHWGSKKGARDVHGRFEFAGAEYQLPITDPDIESEFRRERVGSAWDLSECYMTVSLGGIYRGDYYKFIAGVIQKA